MPRLLFLCTLGLISLWPLLVEANTPSEIRAKLSQARQKLRTGTDWFIRAEGATELGKLKAAAAPAVRDLTRALGDKDNDVRARAAEALGHIGPAGAPAISRLHRLLKSDPVQRVQVQAAFALGQMGTKAARTIPDLIRHARDSYNGVLKKAAIIALGKMKTRAASAIPVFLQLFTAESRRVRYAAAQHLHHLGKSSLPQMEKRLAHPNAHVRFWTTWSLHFFGQDASHLTKKVLALLDDRDWEVRRVAAQTLGHIANQNHPQVVPGLIKGLDAPYHKLRNNSRDSLARLYSKLPKEVLPALLKVLLKHRQWNSRYLASEAIGKALPPGKQVIKALRTALKFRARNVVRMTCKTVYLLDAKSMLPAVPDLIRNLRIRDKSGRYWASRALAKLYPLQPKIMRRVGKLLKVRGWRKREGAARFAAWMGPKAVALVPKIIPLVRDKSVYVRRYATHALEKIKSWTPEVIKALLEALGDDNVHVRRAATRAFVDMGSTKISTLTPLLTSENVHQRYWSAEALGKYGEASAGIAPQLIPLFNDQNRNVRYCAARALARIGVKALPHLRKTCGHNIDLYRGYAAWALELMGDKCQPALPELIQLLQDDNPWVRKRALFAIRKLKEKAESAIPALLALFKKKDRQLSIDTGVTLKYLGPIIRSYMVAKFNSSDDYLRYWVLQALGNIGPKCSSTKRAILPLLQAKDGEVRLNAVWSLGKFGVKSFDIFPRLCRALKDPEKKVKYEAAEAIGRMNHRGVPFVVPYLKDSDGEVRYWAVNGLRQMGRQAKLAVPHLIPLLRDPEAKVRAEVARALRAIGHASGPAIPHLLQTLTDSEQSVVMNAAEALEGISLLNPSAPAAYRAGLQDRDWRVRLYSTWAVGFYEPPPREVENTLRKLTKDPNPLVQNAAQIALQWLTSDGKDEVRIRTR